MVDLAGVQATTVFFRQPAFGVRVNAYQLDQPDNHLPGTGTRPGPCRAALGSQRGFVGNTTALSFPEELNLKKHP